MTPEEAYNELLLNALGPDEASATETVLTKSQLESLVGEELDHDEVYNRDVEYTERYRHLVVAYGFTSFYPLYVMTEMNEMEKAEKAGNKDFSRLHKVKRTVIRNGKPMQTTIYADPDEGDNERIPEDNGTRTSKGSSLRNARDMTGRSVITTGKELKDLMSNSTGLKKREGGRITLQSLSGATGAFTLTDELGETRALVTFAENEKYVYIKDIADDGETSGIGLRSFFELLAFAKTKDKGLVMDDTENPLALNLFKHFNLTKRKDGTWAITRSSLNDVLGGLTLDEHMTLGAVIGVLVNVVFYAILSYRLAKRSVILDEREQAIEELLSKAESTMELVEEIIDMSRAEILEANKLTVSEMMEKRGGQEEYDLFVGLVSEIVREKYETFRFLRQDPSPEDFESGNCLIFQIHREEYPEVYETLFRLAIIHHLEEGEITKAFTRAVKDNAVIPIGEVEIQDIGTGISSVTQGHDIRALITFKTPEYIAEGEKVKEKAEKESKKKAMEDKKLGSIRGEAVRAVNKGTAVINEMMTTLNDVDPDNAKATRNAMAHVQDIVKEAYGKTFS